MARAMGTGRTGGLDQASDFGCAQVVRLRLRTDFHLIQFVTDLMVRTCIEWIGWWLPLLFLPRGRCGTHGAPVWTLGRSSSWGATAVGTGVPEPEDVQSVLRVGIDVHADGHVEDRLGSLPPRVHCHGGDDPAVQGERRAQEAGDLAACRRSGIGRWQCTNGGPRSKPDPMKKAIFSWDILWAEVHSAFGSTVRAFKYFLVYCQWGLSGGLFRFLSQYTMCFFIIINDALGGGSYAKSFSLLTVAVLSLKKKVRLGWCRIDSVLQCGVIERIQNVSHFLHSCHSDGEGILTSINQALILSPTSLFTHKIGCLSSVKAVYNNDRPDVMILNLKPRQTFYIVCVLICIGYYMTFV